MLRERLHSPGARLPWILAQLVRAYALAGKTGEDSWFDPLRSDPRFAEILRRVGFAEE